MWRGNETMSHTEGPEERGIANLDIAKRPTKAIRFLIYLAALPIGLIASYYIIFKMLWILAFRIELLILDMVRFWNWLGLGDWMPLL